MTQKRLCACRPMSGRGRGRGVCVGVCVGVVSPFALPSHVRGVLLCRHRVDVDSGRALPVVADGLGRTLANGGCRQRARFAQLCGRNATGVHTQRDRPLDHRPLPAGRVGWFLARWQARWASDVFGNGTCESSDSCGSARAIRFAHAVEPGRNRGLTPACRKCGCPSRSRTEQAAVSRANKPASGCRSTSR